MPVLIWTDEAREELGRILAFIAERNRSADLRLTDAIARATERLTEHRFLRCTGRVPGPREIVVHPNYIVVYRVAATEVLATSVLHARQRYT